MTDEITVPLPAPVQHAPAAPVEAAAAVAPLSAPYRSGAEAQPGPATSPREWPVLGLTLWVFGVAMWSFVVMGELAVSYGPGRHGFLVSEGVAELFILAATVGAWGVALRKSLASTPARSTARAVLRGAGVALLAFLLWGFVTLFAAAFGSTVRTNLDGKITVMLALLAAGAAFGGRRMAGLHRDDKTPRQRAVARALWVGAALVTIVAMAEVIAD